MIENIDFKEYIRKPQIIDMKIIVKARVLQEYTEVQNAFGVETGNVGDYLVEDDDGIHYIFKKEVFEARYREIS